MEVKNADYEKSAFWQSFKTYVASFVNSHSAARQITNELGVKRTTARDWTGGKMPRLESYIPLGYYLVEKGYSIPEFEKLPGEFRELGEVLREKKYAIKDILQEVSIDGHLLFAVCCGGLELTEHELARLRQFLRRLPNEPMMDSVVQTSTSDIPNLLAIHLKAVIPLVQHLVSDRCSEKERRRFRELMGYEKFFNLVTDLYQLVGERSRGSIKELY